MSEVKTRFGKKLRKIRRNQDLTQAQLAELVGVSVDFISVIERGLSSPSFETIQKFGEVLEVDFSEFFLPPEKK
jgi:transcriptional regulator with XRE-family HTH domain